MAQIPDQLLEDIKKSSHIVAATHTNPDGDALGSLLGFSFIMESLGKKVFCLLEKPLPKPYQFLPGAEKLSCDLAQCRAFIKEAAGDGLLAVSLDCGDQFRLGDRVGDELLAIEPFAVIDHHSSHQEFGTSRWVDKYRSSTGEMVFEIAEKLGVTLSVDAATNLYAAISTDTGSFRYECTSSRTMRIAAQLLDCGVCPDKTSEKLYDNYSPARLLLLQDALASVRLYKENRVALMIVTQKMLRNAGATMDDTDNFINFPRAVETVRVAVLIKEAGNGLFSISMRAKGEVDVAKIAESQGGGGHRNAAGFRCKGIILEQVEELLLDIVGRAVDEGS